MDTIYCILYFIYFVIPDNKQIFKLRTMFPGGEEVNRYTNNDVYTMEREFSSKKEAEEYIPPFPVTLEITDLPWAKDPYLGTASKEDVHDKVLQSFFSLSS